MRKGNFPSYDTQTGLFYAYLLAGNKMTSFLWKDVTGRQFANQRFHDLKVMGLPVISQRHWVDWSRRSIALYSLDADYVAELGDWAIRYIEAAEKFWQLPIKKGVNRQKTTPYRVGQTTEALK